MRAIGTAMRQTARNYRDNDNQAADDLNQFHKLFDGISVQAGQ